MLGILEGDTHAAWINEHGLGVLVKQLRTAHDEFAAALHARDGSNAPSWDDVKSARERGQELYLQIVARMVVRFLDDADARDEVLEPVWDQDQLIRAYRRRRRSVVDIDPDSGEAIDLDDGSGDEAEATTETSEGQPSDA